MLFFEGAGMKTIEKLRDQINDEAIVFLRNGLYAENPDSCPPYLGVSITALDKKKDSAFYDDELKIFKVLFNATNERYKIILWNRLTLFYTEKTKFCKEDFSQEEFAFIKAALKAAGNPIYEANVNNPLETDRLLLRAIEKSDFKLFAQHYKHDGDFELFYGKRPQIK